MANLAVTEVARGIIGTQRFVVANLALDSSYPTGGEALTPTDLGLSRIYWLSAEPTGGYTFQYDNANQKLKAFRTGAINLPGEEVPNATSLAAITAVRVFAFGVA
jgi:hypothetical protein